MAEHDGSNEIGKQFFTNPSNIPATEIVTKVKSQSKTLIETGPYRQCIPRAKQGDQCEKG